MSPSTILMNGMIRVCAKCGHTFGASIVSEDGANKHWFRKWAWDMEVEKHMRECEGDEILA